MGMAASQARYLGLTARKTNCEWEGQQINQARTALANQSADLFNQLLNLKVPDCPDKTDFTKIQYSYTDGFNDSVLDNWRQLSDSTNDYNYMVDHYYYADIYTGSKKLMSDPQVTLKNDSGETSVITSIYNLVSFDNLKNSYSVNAIDPETGLNMIDDLTGAPITYVYKDLSSYKYEPDLQNAILDLVQQGKIELPNSNINGSEIKFTNEVSEQLLASLRGYHDGVKWHLATVKELEDASKLYLNDGFIDLSQYGIGSRADIANLTDDEVTALMAAGVPGADIAEARLWLDNYQDGQNYYNLATGAVATPEEALYTKNFRDMSSRFSPQFVGNARLKPLTSLSLQDETALAQIVKDCSDSSIAKYIKLNSDGSIEYGGAGIYTFEWNGAQKFVTEDDLVYCMETPLFDEKPIEAQYKLPTYEANYIKQEVKETEKALLESDGKGRFKTVKFQDDSTTYTLNCEQITDEATYNDAMNSYYHDVAEYEKKIADINAQTEIIQQQDRTLELRLKQLDTEQNALQTEMEAVKKVISKNVEMTFKTFSGS